MATTIAGTNAHYRQLRVLFSKGVLAAANRMGFVSRFFNSVFNPY